MFRKISIFILLISTLNTVSCKKKSKQAEDNVPYQSVNITLYPNDPLYVGKLGHIGGWVYYNGGVNGIIIYRLTQNSSADFVAIERTSTHLPDNPGAAVKVQSDNFTLKDTVSGSKWQITNGGLLSGPATTNLKTYTAIYDSGSDKLTIRN